MMQIGGSHTVCSKVKAGAAMQEDVYLKIVQIGKEPRGLREKKVPGQDSNFSAKSCVHCHLPCIYRADMLRVALFVSPQALSPPPALQYDST